MTARFAVTDRTFITTACFLVWAYFPGAGSAVAAVHVTVDGFVGGPGDSYSQVYDVTFDVEDGPSGLGGGELHIKEDVDSLWVGFIAPLSTDDNTYGANKDASWGLIKHLLRDGGGDSLEGSDKWEIQIADFGTSGNEFMLKLDYVHDDKSNATTVFDVRIEEIKANGAKLDPSDFSDYVTAFDTSLAYNHDLPGTAAYFETHDEYDAGAPVSSPLATDFAALGWIPEIMYEVQFKKSGFAALGFDLTEESFLEALFLEGSVFHMSPLKNGHHKLYAVGVEIVPEPSTIVVWSLLGLMFTIGSCRRWKRQA